MEVTLCLGPMLYALVILLMKAVMPAERFSTSITSTGFWVTAVVSFFILALISFWKSNRCVKNSPEENEGEKCGDSGKNLCENPCCCRFRNPDGK